MNGQGFSALADGLMGGFNMGKSMKKPDATTTLSPNAKASSAAGSTQEGYSGDLSGFTPGKPGAEEAAAPTEQAGTWGKISGMFDSVVEGAKDIPVIGGALKASPAGHILSGGLGNTVFGKLTGGKGLEGTILGKLTGGI